MKLSITKEMYEVIENPKNMPKDPPTEPINPDSVMTSTSSLICLLLEKAPTLNSISVELLA